MSEWKKTELKRKQKMWKHLENSCRDSWSSNRRERLFLIKFSSDALKRRFKVWLVKFCTLLNTVIDTYHWKYIMLNSTLMNSRWNDTSKPIIENLNE